MGGTSKSDSSQTSQLLPWEPLSGAVSGVANGITGLLGNWNLTPTENGALNTLNNNAAAGNPFSGAISNAANSMLSGGGANNFNGLLTGAYDGLKNTLSPIANGVSNGLGLLKDQFSTMLNDVTNNYNGQFAANGRDPSGNAAAPQAIARGFAQGAAPILAAQNNTDIQNRMNAASTLYGAGNATGAALANNQQAFNANRQAGVGLAQNSLDANNWSANSLLANEAQRRGIPIQNLGILSQLAMPWAAQFGKQTGTSHTENQMSGAQQFGLIANGIGSLWPKSPIFA